jgi:hypothetical protein
MPRLKLIKIANFAWKRQDMDLLFRRRISVLRIRICMDPHQIER